MNILEADSIQIQFGNRSILSNVYLKCETGKITGLLGRNGQGKSCLMNAIYGTLNCERSIRLNNVSMPEIYKRADLLVYLPQFNFIPRSLSLKRIFREFALDFQEFIDWSPMYERDYKSAIGDLSGGGYRLVELYVIIKSKSRFAMLDEPFTHLSPLQIEMLKELLLTEKEKKGMLITDHLFTHVLDVCDNLYVISNGSTCLATSPEDIETLGYARI